MTSAVDYPIPQLIRWHHRQIEMLEQQERDATSAEPRATLSIPPEDDYGYPTWEEVEAEETQRLHVRLDFLAQKAKRDAAREVVDDKKGAGAVVELRPRATKRKRPR